MRKHVQVACPSPSPKRVNQSKSTKHECTKRTKQCIGKASHGNIKSLSVHPLHSLHLINTHLSIYFTLVIHYTKLSSFSPLSFSGPLPAPARSFI